MSARRLSLVLLVVGLLFALWPVKADATRYELAVASGAQPQPQLDARMADPAQRPLLEQRPSCGIPLLAPLTYTQDTSLRGGCAGPNARSMSLAVLTLLAAAGVTARRASLGRATSSAGHG